MILKYALKELWHYRRFSFLYVLGSLLGSLGITLVLFYGNEVAQQLRERSKDILSADFSISSRRAIADSEIARYEAEFRADIADRSQIYEFFGMIGKGAQSRLVLIKAIDEKFPFYGSMQNPQSQNLVGNQLKENEIWVYPELKVQMGLELGDHVKIGEAQFTVKEYVEKDRTQTFRLAQLAPRVFINLEGLKKTRLITLGSTYTQAFLYKFTPTADASAVEKKMSKEYRDPTIRFTAFQEASESSSRQFKMFSDFLTLSALIAFLIGLFGQFFINQSFLKRRLHSFSYLRLQGASRGQIQGIVLFELVVLGVIASVLAILASIMAMPALNAYLQRFMSFSSDSQSYWSLFFIAMSLTAVNSLLSFLPFRGVLLNTSPRILLSTVTDIMAQTRIRVYLALLFTLLFSLAVVISRSWRFALIFMAVIVFNFIVAQIFTWILTRKSLERSTKNWRWIYILRSIRERKFSYQILIISILISVVFVSLLPQIKGAIENEMRPSTTTQPSLFLFDIQDEQWPALVEIFEKAKITDYRSANMVRARILSVNGKPYERQEQSELATREEEAEARSRNRGVNMTIKGELNSTEELVEGRLFKAEGPEVSLEEKYAERMGIKVGDQVKFDIQGVEISAPVTSLRKVNWNSFSPNFFIVFKPGFIDDAPKTYLASLPSGIDKFAVQAELFQKFPNISAIDLERFIAEGIKLFGQISVAFSAMSYLSLLLGFLVFSIILIVSVDERKREFSLLRLLGVVKGEIGSMVMIENLAVVLLCALLGSAMSLLVSAILMKMFFDTIVVLNIQFYAIMIVTVIVVSVVLVRVLSWNLTQKNPLELLRD